MRPTNHSLVHSTLIRKRTGKDSKWKGLDRFAVEQIIRLAVFGIPLALLAVTANFQIAKYNTQYREIEYQRKSWEQLERSLMIAADAFFQDISEQAALDQREVLSQTDKDRWTPPTTSEFTRLLRVIERIRLYGNSHRDPSFIAYCDYVVSRLYDLGGELSQYADFADEINSQLETLSRLDPNEDNYDYPSIESVYRGKSGLIRHIHSEYRAVTDSINNLSLMIFDPSYTPPEFEEERFQKNYFPRE